MNITQFRKTKTGPEHGLEIQVLSGIAELLPNSELPAWAAGSVPIGAGYPDIVIIAYRPEIYALCDASLPVSHILGYLRAVRHARLGTIADRVGLPTEIVVRCVKDLVKYEIITEGNQSYSLTDVWKDILPDISTIEVKVSNWKRAAMQAARNRIFAHRSYVALPESIAIRVAGDPLFSGFGIGVLGVFSDSRVKLIKQARKTQPKVWDYYYRLAELTAAHTGGQRRAIYCPY